DRIASFSPRSTPRTIRSFLPELCALTNLRLREDLVQCRRPHLVQPVGGGRRDGGADHRPLPGVVPRPAAVEHGPVVPHDGVALPPFVDIDELAPRRLV